MTSQFCDTKMWQVLSDKCLGAVRSRLVGASESIETETEVVQTLAAFIKAQDEEKFLGKLSELQQLAVRIMFRVSI